MGFIRKRANGALAYVFMWKGKRHTKNLGTDNEQEADQIRKDADDQLARIRNGQSAVASRLLADGHSIMDVLFGSDEIAHLIPDAPDNNPLTLSQLRDAFMDYLRDGGRTPGHIEGTKVHMDQFISVLGNRRVASLTDADMADFKRKREKKVRKTVSGLVKLMYPDGEVDHEQLAELLDLALEGRRRVKEQLKKMGSFEYHQTSFSYIDNESREERFVGVPEQGGKDVIATDPLAPGSVYATSVDDQGKVGLYRLEVGTSPGTGKLRVAGGVEGPMKESIQRAFAFLSGHKVPMGIAQQVDTTDFHVEGIDLLGNRVPCEAGIALIVAVYSAIKKHAVLPALVILGDLSIQGNIKSVHSLVEPLQVAMDNGARRALVPLENKRNFLEVAGDVVERVDPVFYSDPVTAAMKALGMT